MFSSIFSKFNPSVLKSSVLSTQGEASPAAQLGDPKFKFANKIKRDNVADHMIIWHDPNVNSEENEGYYTILEGICEYRTFEDWKLASQCIKNTTVQCHVLTSGTHGEQFTKEISGLKQVAAIYVFCKNVDYHSQWAKRFYKVNVIEDILENVLNKMHLNMAKMFRQRTILRANFPEFISVFDDSADSARIEAYLDLYVKGFTGPANRAQSEEDFQVLAKESGQNMSHYSFFKNSYKKYDGSVILQKYNDELYKVVNSCLRIGTLEAIQPCQYILRDLELAIREQYGSAEKNYSGLLYKGAFLSRNEWQKLEGSVGKEIELYGFLFANKVEAGCNTFLKVDTDSKVKITIIIPAALEKEKQGFVDLKDDEEILFNVRSRFRVLNTITKEVEGIQCRHLFLLYGYKNLRHHIEETSPTIEIKFPDVLECDYCGSSVSLEENDDIFYINMVSGSKRICCISCKSKREHNKHPLLVVSKTQLAFLEGNNKSLRIEGIVPENPQMINVPFFGYECSECQTTEFAKCYKCAICQQPNKKWCGKCISQKIECIDKKHFIVLEENPYTFINEKLKENQFEYPIEVGMKFYTSLKEKISDDMTLSVNVNEALGSIYEVLGRFPEAVHSYKESLKNINPKKPVKIASLESKLARVYNALGRHDEARESRIMGLEKRMEAFKEIKGRHYLVAVSNEEIGDSYLSLGYRKIGKGFYKKALGIMNEVLSPKHKKYAEIYVKLGRLKDNVGKKTKAVEFYEKAVGIKQYLNSNDLEFGIMLSELAEIYCSLERFQDALMNYSKALRIEEGGEKNQVFMANLYEKIGSMYYKINNIKKAKENHELSLKIRLSMSADGQSQEIAASYNLLGEIYQRMRNPEKAKEYLMKALEIRESLLGLNHLLTAASYYDVGELYDALGDFSKALEYHQKALEIKQNLVNENDPELAVSFGVLAMIYFNLNDPEQSEKNNWKALDIYKKKYGEEHNDVALIYNNLAIVYDSLNKPQLVKEYFTKAGDIWSKVLGSNHPSTIETYKNLINVLKELGEDETAEIYQILIDNQSDSPSH